MRDHPTARRIVLLTEGHSEPLTGKTASCLLRYCADEIVALLDSTQAGRTADDLFGMGGAIPVVGCLADAVGANELVIGLAPPGGQVPAAWRPILLEAIARGLRIVSGLHDFLGDDPELAAAAAARGVEIRDVRRNAERDVSSRLGLRDDCLRLLTIGHDCSVGKMVAAVELARGLIRRGGGDREAEARATRPRAASCAGCRHAHRRPVCALGLRHGPPRPLGPSSGPAAPRLLGPRPSRRAALQNDRSANGTSASVGRAERIMRSSRRSWSGWMRPDRGGAEELPIHAQGRSFLVGADRP